MCEQTEINYLHGDVVWVKLGSYWWPGQVVGLENLPEDVQVEFQKKPLIAAVKFFQEDSFEFVKNYQQIYKYNCTQKDDFIKKGLDKYRAKSKDGSNYLNKFPEDVKIAEMLTDGDPDILTSDKFSPEEKPDISGLFGEKKILKKKRNRDDYTKKNDSDLRKRVTHPRFLQGSDHEVRIRHQPTNPPTSLNSCTSSGIYPCHVCGFTATRVNVIICHLKNHRLNNETAANIKTKVKSNPQIKPKPIISNSPKRKYVRKSVPGKSKNESSTESGKRKHSKSIEKPHKKKKSDPELREKLLADWNVDSDDDETSDFGKSADTSSVDLSSKNQFSTDVDADDTDILKDDSSKDNDDSIDLLQKSNKLLEETDTLSKLSILKDVPDNVEKVDEIMLKEEEKTDTVMSPKTNKEIFHFKKLTVEKSLPKEKDDKKSRLSCFDFDEDDMPEPSISSVRKIPRGLGSKNMSIKKEIIKEFELSQALKNETEKDSKNDEIHKIDLNRAAQIVFGERVQIAEDGYDNKIVANIEKEINEPFHKPVQKTEKPAEICETRVEIVEIFEVEKDDEGSDIVKETPNEFSKKEVNEEDRSKTETIDTAVEADCENDAGKAKFDKSEVAEEKIIENFRDEMKTELIQEKNVDKKSIKDKTKEEIEKEFKEMVCSPVETSNTSNFLKNNISSPTNISHFQSEQISDVSENTELIPNEIVAEEKCKTTLLPDTAVETQEKFEENLNSNVKKRRGRPRKNVGNADETVSDNEPLKSDEIHKKMEVSESDRKTSESDSDRSYSGRKRKPNRKYKSSLFVQKFDYRSPKTDESLSESDDKPDQLTSKTTKAKKAVVSKTNFLKLKEDSLKSPNHVDDQVSNNLETDVEKVVKDDSNIDKIITDRDCDIEMKDTSKEHKDSIVADDNLVSNNEIAQDSVVLSDSNTFKETKIVAEEKVCELQTANNDIELLPPKKSQIKKFELSQLDAAENNIKNINVDLNINEPKIDEVSVMKEVSKEESVQSQPESSEKVIKSNTEVEVTQDVHSEANFDKVEETEESTIDKTVEIKSSSAIVVEEPKVDFKIDDIPIVIAKDSEEKFDNQFIPLQDALINTSETENSLNVPEKIESEILETKTDSSNDLKNTSVAESVTNTETLTQEPVITNFSMMDNFDSIEVVVADNNIVEDKPDEVISLTNNKNIVQLSKDSALTDKNKNDKTDSVVLETPVTKISEKKLDEPPIVTALPTLVTDTQVTIPVKKREKPRIIENVTLKEPMILKTKLMEKHISKIGKHKLETDNLKSGEMKSFPRTKIMKMDTVIPTSKSRSPIIGGNQSFTVAKKVMKTLKTEDSSPTMPVTDVRNEQVITALPQSISEVPCAEKYIQQSSQSLVDMDLDINSMPFVLSEDVLTPESIEQMPVVISSVLPATNPVTTLSTTPSTTLITPTKQIISANQSFESTKESSEATQKKKTGTPTILKSKSKAKPTITSIKTIVPPLTSTAYKGGYKVNTQGLKTTLGNQKTSGKYVIVQTSGHQQAYSTHQKGTIPTSKSSGNAQIVQQGNKVVILTSPQSGQSTQKVLPINSLKALNSGKTSRIITTKQGQQVLTAISPQSLASGKTTILTKSGEMGSSPIVSKVVGSKIISQQQVLTSKSVLTQLPGSITKSTVLSSIPQGIITKDGIFTPINASLGKTIISTKGLVTKSFCSQNLNTSKNILTPITQSISGKTIINSQGIVSKGTVLTPITGSQVKALAAKNIKGSKIQYQTIQRKIQVTGTPKQSKTSAPSSPAQASTSLKTTNNVIVVPNTETKNVVPTKKIIKQTGVKSITTTVLTSPVTAIHQKSKIAIANPDQKNVSPKTTGRSIKLDQKVSAEKIEEGPELKSLIKNEASSLKTKVVEPVKQTDFVPVMKSNKVGSKNIQKKLINVENSTTVSSPNLSASQTVTVPPVESISHELIPKKEETVEQLTSTQEVTASNSQTVPVTEGRKVEESKVSPQTQIMALPTENSDGTQTYVLVTVDEQGHIVPLDNNTLMSLDGTSNFDGSRTLYIDSSSLGETGNMDNIVLQIDNGSLSGLQASAAPTSTQTAAGNIPSVTGTIPSTEITQTANQDILAAALANTDFQHEIGVNESPASTTMTNLTQTSLINQTILQSTIIPPTEPISSPLVLETSLTLNQPIMTPLEVPSTLPIQSDLAAITTSAGLTTSLDLPITVNKQNIAIQISDNSVPEIAETMSTASVDKVVDTTEIQNDKSEIETKLVDNTITEIPETESKSAVDNSISTSISTSDFDNKKIQTTPSMPIIDDSFNANNGFDSSNASVVVEDNLRNFVTKTSEELIQDLTGTDSLPENSETFSMDTVSHEKASSSVEEVVLEATPITLSDTQYDHVSSQQSVTPTVEQSEEKVTNEVTECSSETNVETLPPVRKLSEDMCTVPTESSTEVQSSHEIQIFDVEDQVVEAPLVVTNSESEQEKHAETLNQDLSSSDFQTEPPTVETKSLEMIVDETTDKDMVVDDSNQVTGDNCKIIFEAEVDQTKEESPSQSYEQLVSATSDVVEVPSQSAKSESLPEATQSYEPMETDDSALVDEPPTQSYEPTKANEASQSCKTLSEITDAPTQSFDEMIEVNEERVPMDESMDDPNFPTQSTYEVEKMETNTAATLETDSEISQEGNTPSQSNDIGADGIGTSLVSTNNAVLNEDETASSSYVPETPENQERDQDQESAISTSSYEIPPCEELNIASSSVIPDTSAQSEHSSIHNNGVPEIPISSSLTSSSSSSSSSSSTSSTSSYNLNPDSSSTHVDAVPTSSYEDQIVVEQNVSTSYQVPASMASFEEPGSQSYVTDSSDQRNEPSSYYSSHPEVTDSYYSGVCKQSDSRLEPNSEEEATPSYYESRTPLEASGSYFNQEEATPSYSNHDVSASYYDPRTEAEASQSYYSSHDMNKSNQSALQNAIEATQSFYQENSEEQRLSQRGEATPTYTDRYSLDYVPVSSPLDRHDLVESSVPARSMDR